MNKTRLHKYTGPQRQKTVAQYISNQSAEPLHAIQRQPLNPAQPGGGSPGSADATTGEGRTREDAAGQAGTYTTDPQEIDNIIRQAWDKVYNGNVQDMDKLVTDFGHKYADYIYNAAEYPIQAIKWQDLKKECSKNTTSAGGMDGWTKADLAWASDYAFQWLAAWYTSIEASRKWPTELTKARAVFLAKDSNDTGNPNGLSHP